ncbi:hypothetical protein TUMEXPCC7403_20740 [Tumidithrix helvetica PCC 7403]|uniref:serine hydrolase n=1 Tax=Tumidithrix helvetica TaxID=3457545 RepID=UPI003C91A526
MIAVDILISALLFVSPDAITDEVFFASKVDIQPESVNRSLPQSIEVKGVESFIIIDIETGAKVGRNTTQVQRSVASISKLFIAELVAKNIKQEKLRLEEIKNDLDAMLSVSDNFASNRLIHRLGGFAEINRQLREQGYKQTQFDREYGILFAGQDPNQTNLEEIAETLTRLTNISGDLGQFMRDALQRSEQKENLGSDFGKIGINAAIIGNAGVVQEGRRKFVIIILTSGTDIQSEDLGLEIVRQAFSEVRSRLQGKPKS